MLSLTAIHKSDHLDIATCIYCMTDPLDKALMVYIVPSKQVEPSVSRLTRFFIERHSEIAGLNLATYFSAHQPPQRALVV